MTRRLEIKPGHVLRPLSRSARRRNTATSHLFEGLQQRALSVCHDREKKLA